MGTSKPIILYDIASAPPVTCFAPNPWKARYALNFKGANYKTEWVELPEVTSVRKELGAAPNRSHRDGSPFYTLPVIKDLATGEVVGDSFDIARYLDKTYPDGPTLLPPSTVGLHRAFNAQADAAFTDFVILMVHGIPFNPETVESSRATFVERAGADHWDKLTIQGEERTKTLAAFKARLGELEKFYRCTEGLFLEGDSVTYADIIVGGWLQFVKATLPEWEDVQSWHDGLWGKIHQGLEKYAQVK